MPTPGSGSVWTLSIGNSGNATAATGVFSPVGTDWTTVSATFPVVGDVADYVDANGELLITVSCAEPDSTQVCRRTVGLFFAPAAGSLQRFSILSLAVLLGGVPRALLSHTTTKVKRCFKAYCLPESTRIENPQHPM